MIKHELEKLHYRVIRPGLERAECQAKPLLRSCTPGTFNPFSLWGSLLQEQMEMRKDELSGIVESMDCQSQGMTPDELDTRIMGISTNTPGANPFRNYVRPAGHSKTGYKVFDGNKWVELSEQATIHVNDGFGQETQVYAEDPATGYRLRVFKDPDTPGIEMAESTNGMFPDEMNGLHHGTFNTNPLKPENRYTRWEDPYYQTAKTGIAPCGAITGVLEYRQVGELIPGIRPENNMGWPWNQEGKLRRLSRQKTGPGLHKISTIEGRLFVVGLAFSGCETTAPFYQNNTNKWGVNGKATLDVTMAVIGTFGDPIGWNISGNYFIGDMYGRWGDRDKSAAQQQLEAETLKQHQRYGRYMMQMVHDREFTIALGKTSRQELWENAMQVRDNTELRIPRPIKEIMNTY